MSQTKRFSKNEAISFGWNIFRDNFRFLILIFLIFLLFAFVPDIIGSKTIEASTSLGVLFYSLGYFLTIVMTIGIMKISLKFYDSEKPEISDLFSHYKLFINYFLASFLYALIVFAGLILLIVPGIVFGLKYYFFDYYVVDKGCGPIEALKRSAQITKGNKWNLFLFILLVLGINILGMIFLFVGLLVTIPVTALATAFVYRKLSEPSEVILKEEENKMSPADAVYEKE